MANKSFTLPTLPFSSTGHLVQPTPDEDLIGAIRIGNEAVFEAVFRQYYAPLCQYGRSIVHDSDEAEEMVQAVFLTVWERRDSLLITTSLKAYLYRSVHNRCLNRLKQISVQAGHREQAALELYTGSDGPAQAVMTHELTERLRTAIARLPDQCRRIFEMSRFDELRYADIAGQLGLSVKTVENQIGKALRILRTELSDYLPILFFYVSDLACLLTQLNPLTFGFHHG